MHSKEHNQISQDPDDWSADHCLDARGLYCPEPVMMLHNKVRDIASGDTMKLVASDPSTTRDVPKFCVYLDHELVDSSEREGEYFYLIRKKTE